LSYILKKNVCIPRSFLVINVCNQEKTLCSPCTLEPLVCPQRPGTQLPHVKTDRGTQIILNPQQPGTQLIHNRYLKSDRGKQLENPG